MTRAEIKDKLSRRCCMTNEEAGMVLEVFLSEIIDSVLHGEKVEIRGFGSFRPKEYLVARAPYQATRPAVKKKKAVKFRPFNQLNERVNSGPV